jgi:hypothetical protein
MSNPTGSEAAFVGPLVAAQVAWSALKGHGLEAWLLDQGQGSLFELGSVSVAVRAEDLERAREILGALDLARKD